MKQKSQQSPSRYRWCATLGLCAVLAAATPAVCLAAEVGPTEGSSAGGESAIDVSGQDKMATLVITDSETTAPTPTIPSTTPAVVPVATDMTLAAAPTTADTADGTDTSAGAEGQDAAGGDSTGTTDAADGTETGDATGSTDTTNTPSEDTDPDEKDDSQDSGSGEDPTDDAGGQVETPKGAVYIDGRWYYYDDEGNRVTGWKQWDDKTWSYYDPDGAAATGWRKVGGKWYYLDPDTLLASSNSEKKIEGKTYSFDDSCAMVTGWRKWGVEERVIGEIDWSWADASGVEVTGWKQLNGTWYYFDLDTLRAIEDGGTKVGGKWYAFDKSCAMVTGWRKWAGNTWSWHDASGAAATGWKKINGKWYFFDPNAGINGDLPLAVPNTEVKGKDKTYAFDKNCAMLIGWHKWSDGWSWSGTDGAVRSGWQKINKKWYYLRPETYRAAENTEVEIKGKTYSFDSSCAMRTSWYKWSDGWSYAGTDGVEKSGWLLLGNTWYYLEPDTLRAATGRYEVSEGKSYYFQSDCSLATRKWLQLKGDDGPTWADCNGLLTTVSGASLDSSGKLKDANPGWLRLGAEWAFIKSDGTAQTGWKAVSSSGKTDWYYLEPATGVTVEGFVKIGDAYYNFEPKSQIMQTGWQTVGTHRYYFDPTTGKAATSSRKIDGVTHYFDSNGREFTALQLKLIQAAKRTPTTPPGYCSEWITNVFRNAGIATFFGDACDQYRWFCNSSDRSELRAGMIVAVSKHSNTYLGRIYGHVCLYIGDGKIMDSIGRVRTMDLQPWLDHYGNMVTPKWGWGGNVALA